MSSDSDLSSLSEDEQPNSRLHSIWNSIKQTKNISQMYRNHQQHDQSSHHQQQHSLHTKGRDSKHHEKEQHTQQSRENLTHVLRKLQESHEEKEDLKCELDKVRRENEEEIDRLRKDYESKIRAQRRRNKTNEKENINDNREQKGKIELLTKEIQRLTLRIKSLEFQKKTRDADNERLTESNELYLRKLSQGQQKIGSDVLQLKGRGEQLLELSEANRTIERLVELLKKTEQFRQFSPLMSDLKNLHYLKNIPKRMKSNQLNIKTADRKVCGCCIKIVEKLLWSPTECYRTMLEMKLKYDYLSEDCIEEVLFEINRIYSSREEKNIKRVREHYQVQIAKLKKKIQENYDQLLAKKQINRLKKELRVFKSLQKGKVQPKIDGLKNKGQYEDQLKLKDRQIRLLHERIKLFQTENGFYDKSLYFQGALWIIDKILSEVQANEGSLKQFQVNFRQRIDQNMQAQDWLRSYKQFFQTLTELNGQLVQRLFSIKDSTLKKMSVSSKMQQG